MYNFSFIQFSWVKIVTNTFTNNSYKMCLIVFFLFNKFEVNTAISVVNRRNHSDCSSLTTLNSLINNHNNWSFIVIGWHTGEKCPLVAIVLSKVLSLVCRQWPCCTSTKYGKKWLTMPVCLTEPSIICFFVSWNLKCQTLFAQKSNYWWKMLELVQDFLWSLFQYLVTPLCNR